MSKLKFERINSEKFNSLTSETMKSVNGGNGRLKLSLAYTLDTVTVGDDTSGKSDGTAEQDGITND